MDKQLKNLPSDLPIVSLTIAEQAQIKGGLAAMCDEKKKRVVVRS
jgi:hypothetical protein